VHSKDSVATDDKCHGKDIVSHLAPQGVSNKVFKVEVAQLA
jgi:hypothetical protein